MTDETSHPATDPFRQAYAAHVEHSADLSQLADDRTSSLMRQGSKVGWDGPKAGARGVP